MSNNPKESTNVFFKNLIQLSAHPIEMQMFMFVSLASYAQSVAEMETAELEDGMIDADKWVTCEQEVLVALEKKLPKEEMH